MPAREFTGRACAALSVVAVLVAIVVTAAVTRAVIADDVPVPTESEPGAYTKRYVGQVLDRYERDGRQATLDYINGGGGVDGDWYMFVIDAETDRMLAHATIPSRVGGDMNTRVDVNGYAYGPALLAATPDGTWVDYVFLNPASGEGGRKHVWAVERDGLIFASGWYEPSYEKPPATKAEPGAYTKEYVARAVFRYQGEGRDPTIDYFNSPESVDGEWYLFIVDETGEVIAHPTVPENVGRSLYGPLGTDVTGRDFGSEIMAATEVGKWVDYVYLNPATGREGVKHSWVVRHDGLVFGSGWYEDPSG